MRVILHDAGSACDEMIGSKCGRMIAADGKYAPVRAVSAAGPSIPPNVL